MRERSVDQCANPWQICRIPGPSGLSTYFSAKRACPTSWPATTRLVLHGASESTKCVKSWTSVIVAAAGMVAQRVIALASDSVQDGVGGGVVSAETPGGDAVPGGLTTRE